MTKRRSFGAIAALALLAGVALDACRRDERGASRDRGTANAAAPDGGPASLASASGVAYGHAPHPFGDASYEPSRRPACRVMSIRGNASMRGRPSRGGYEEDGINYTELRAKSDATPPEHVEPLARGDLIPEWGLLELDAESELTVHSTVSTREITMAGPGIADACPGGEEVVRLGRGKVSAMPGAGIRPGAEVWVATPLGVVRFNDARIEIDVPNADASRLRIAVVTGQATLVAPENAVLTYLDAKGSAEGGRVDPSQRIHPLAPGSVVEVTRPTKPLALWVRDLVAVCGRDGSVAEKAAERIADETERAKIGDLAFEHVRARQLARASCECVRATILLEKDMLDRDLRRVFGSGDSAWKRTLPLPRTMQQALPDAH